MSEPSGSSTPARHETIGERDLGHWRTPVGRRLAALVARAGSAVGIGPAVSVVLGAGGLLTALFVALSLRVYEAVGTGDGIAELDAPALHEAMALRSPAGNRVAATLAEVGGPVWMPVIATVVALTLALAWRTWLPVLLTAAAAAGSLAMTVAGKDAVGRLRPPHVDAAPPYETSPSFPSGHTLNATVIVGVLCYVALLHLSGRVSRRVLVVAASAWVAGMGLSRVYLGAHWLTDVAMGWVLGLGWLTVIVTTHRAWITARRGPRARPADAAGVSVAR